MKHPVFRGRLLPRNDYEGDDATPGAGGKYVTCVDTSVGLMVNYATNGRVKIDGKALRAAVTPRDPNGITLEQAAAALHRLTGLTLHVGHMTGVQAVARITTGKGLVFIGHYAALPRVERYQDAGDFDHAMFAAYKGKPGVRRWDPLNPDLKHWGEWCPAANIRTFIDASNVNINVAWVDLQPLVKHG